MADNLPNTSTTFALPDFSVIRLQGKDACAFAQAQFANDVAALIPGHWQWNCWLTPKGRVIAAFALLKQDEQDLLVVLPDTPGQAFAEQLKRFVLRRKTDIQVLADAHVGARLAPPPVPGTGIARAGDAIELDFGTPDLPRTLRISPQSAAASPEHVERWRALDLQLGLPRLPEAQREQWTPQQLSLERLPAFSVKKGCYPGQEIVARTHFLGKNKRGLALLEADSPIPAGTDVLSGEVTIGKTVSAAAHLALAVLPLERDATPLRAGGIEVRETPLLEGLRRSPAGA